MSVSPRPSNDLLQLDHLLLVLIESVMMQLLVTIETVLVTTLEVVLCQTAEPVQGHNLFRWAMLSLNASTHLRVLLILTGTGM